MPQPHDAMRLRRRNKQGSVLRPFTSGTIGEFDSILRSDVGQEPAAVLDLDILTAEPEKYDTAIVRVNTLKMPMESASFGQWEEAVIVRSLFGAPILNVDGIVVFSMTSNEVAAQAASPNPYIEFNDSPLLSANWYYYSLFVLYPNAGNPVWQRLSKTDVLIPFDYQYRDRLERRVPEYLRMLDELSVAKSARPGLLKTLLERYGYETDIHRTFAYTLGDAWDMRRISSRWIPVISNMLALPFEPEIGDKRFKNLAGSIIGLRKLKGTSDGVEQFISNYSGYRTLSYTGLNILPSNDDAEARHTTGLWTVTPPPTIFYENFNRSDVTDIETLSIGFTTPNGSWGISSNKMVPTVVDGSSVASVIYNTTKTQHYIEFDFDVDASANQYGGLAVNVCYTNLNSRVRVQRSAFYGTWNVYKTVSGTDTLITSIGLTPTDSGRMRVEWDSETTTLKVYMTSVKGGIPALVWSGQVTGVSNGTYVGLTNSEINKCSIDNMVIAGFSPTASTSIERTIAYPNIMSVDASGFESTTGGWTGVTNCTVERVTTTKRTGSASLKVSATAKGTATASSATGASGFSVTAGNTYHYEMWVRSSMFRRTARMAIKWYNSSNAQIGSDEADPGLSVPYEWTRLIDSVTAPTGAVRAAIEVSFDNLSASEELFIDDVACSLIEVNGPEVDDAYFKVTNNSGSTQTVYLTYGIPDPPFKTFDIDKLIPLGKCTNDHLHISFKAKRQSGTGQCAIDLRWYDRNGVLISSTSTTQEGISPKTITSSWTTNRYVFSWIPIPNNAAFVWMSISVTNVANTESVYFHQIQVAKRSWRMQGVAVAASTEPLQPETSGNEKFYQSDYYESARIIWINIYPNRTNLLKNSNFSLNDLPAGAWQTSETPVYSLIPVGYDDYADIIDDEPGDSEESYEDLREGIDPLGGSSTIVFNTAQNRLEMSSSLGASAQFASRVITEFLPVNDLFGISSSVTAWSTHDGGTISLVIEWFSEAAFQSKVGQSVAATGSLTTTPTVFNLKAVYPPSTAKFARLRISTTHPTNSQTVYLSKAIVEDSAVPGGYFDGSYTDGANGDYGFVGDVPFEGPSVMYFNYRTILKNSSDSERLTSILKDILPPERDSKIVTAYTSPGLYAI